MRWTSNLSFRQSPLVLALALAVGLVACDEGPVEPEASDTSIAADAASDAETSPLEARGRNGRAVTVPIEVQLDVGSHVVVPFGDSRIPVGTPVEDCPVGEANSDLDLPAGFPNGGGVVIIEGTGTASHLGRFEVTITRCAAQFFPPTDPPFVNFDSRTRFTAADGSRLLTEVDYVMTPFTPPTVPRLPLSIMGGTGRFAGATGHLLPFEEVEVTCTEPTFCLAGTFVGGTSEGELTLPRSGR
ncbi:MAG: hypothetical protein ACODAA_02900 [Gemmatimonadota bacterium]